MKTYCKPATVNIEDWKFNELAVVECFRNKRRRKDFQRLLCKTGKITKREIVEDQLNKDFKRTLEAESEVAKMLTQRIINRDLQLQSIRQFQRIDGLTQKLRDICQESPERRGKRNRLVYAIVCYADDFTIYGDVSKLKKAMKKATIWAHDKFGLKIKDIWQFYQVASFDEERENLEERRKGSKKRTPGVDMMGYVVRRRYTIIRGRVFRRIRRQVLRAWEDFKAKGFIPWWRACRIAAYKGWIKHSNSLKFRMEYCFDKLFKMCSYSASKHGKEVENEKRILLIAALSS